MNRGNFFRRAFFVAFTVIFAFSAAIVCATVQIFDGTGQYIMSDDLDHEFGKKRAQQRAERDAQKKAGIALKNFSRSINSELADDAVSAVVNNIIQVSDVKIVPIPFEAEGEVGIMYKATLKATIDTDGIYSWLKRDDKEKVTIIQQNTQLQDAIQKNDTLAENLQEQYNRATSQAEKDDIRKQINEVDREFLANLKIIKGQKLYFANNYNEAIKFFNEVININKNSSTAYLMRGCSYGELGKYELAIQDFKKTIELNPNYAVYANLCCGIIYSTLKKYEVAIQYYDKTISLDSNYSLAYAGRGIAYMELKQTERAIQDFDRAIELGINNAEIYAFRGTNYFDSGKYNLAFQCFDKAINLKPNDEMLYAVRGASYFKLKQYDKSIADATKAIQLNPNFTMAYLIRGLCYQELGQPSKSDSDIAKARKLGYNG